MKKILLPIFLLVFLSACSGIAKKTSKLNGKVKTVKETEYKAIEENGEIIKGEVNYRATPTTSVYSKKGNLTEKSQHNSDGSLNKKWIGNFNEKGNRIGRSLYNSDGSLEEKSVFKYDEKENLIETSQYNPDGSLNQKQVNKYDKKGNLIEARKYDSDGVFGSEWIFRYDKKGNRIEESLYNSDGSLKYKWAFKYDKNGNVIEENSHTTYKYEFDKKNNWIKKITYKNSIPQKITVREIEYY